jgi:hypothetical protein
MKTLLKAIKMLEAENKDLEYKLERAELLLKVTMEQNTMLRNDLKLLSDAKRNKVKMY